MTDDAAQPGVTGTVQTFTKNWREPVQFLTALVALVAGAKGIVVPRAQDYFGASGPAIAIHEWRVEPAAPGTAGLMRFVIDKTRACKLASAFVTMTDAKGTDWSLTHGWSVALPTGISLHPTFEYRVPHGVSPGPASMTANISHEACIDGGKAPPTVVAKASVTVPK